MDIFIQTVDKYDHPVQVDLPSIIAEAVLARGVGFFRTSTHVEQDIKDAISDLLKSSTLVHPITYRVCPRCAKTVTVWHKFSDGNISCTACLTS